MGVELLLAGVVAGSGITDAVSQRFSAKEHAKELNAAGDREAARVFSRGRQVLGQQTAAFGASGVTQSGTPQDVADSTVSKIHQEAIRRVMPFFNKAADVKAFANANLASGITKSLLSGISTFLAAGGEFPTDSTKSGNPTGSGFNLLAENQAPSAVNRLSLVPIRTLR